MGIPCRHLHVFSTSLPSSSLGFCPRAPLRYRQPAGPLLAIGQGAPMIRGCPAFLGLKFVIPLLLVRVCGDVFSHWLLSSCHATDIGSVRVSAMPSIYEKTV